MNSLGIDYGTKRIGLAVSINGVVTPLSPIKNDNNSLNNIVNLLNEYSINTVYVGISEGYMAKLTLAFVAELKKMIQLPIETVEESVTTIEADAIYLENKHKKKEYKKKIDSVAAAIILRRALGY